MLASCGKDEVDETWKTLPQEEIAIENGNAHFTVNGIDSKKGYRQGSRKERYRG